MVSGNLNDLKSLHKYIVNNISAIYDKREAENISRNLLMDYFDLSHTDFLTNKELIADKEQTLFLENTISRLLEHEPVQHITGKAFFYGLEFHVNKNVLIPRPETEELVREIINLKSDRPDILDVGTGSGCIAITLAKFLPGSRVDSMDVDENALHIARENAQRLNVQVHFFQADILNDPEIGKTYDIVVSNPPYIPLQEKRKMDRNIVDYEPELALFVPDERPLIFYEKIADFAVRHLKKKGHLFFEIHENMSKRVIGILGSKNFDLIHVKKDLQGKERMVICRL